MRAIVSPNPRYKIQDWLMIIPSQCQVHFHDVVRPVAIIELRVCTSHDTILAVCDHIHNTGQVNDHTFTMSGPWPWRRKTHPYHWTSRLYTVWRHPHSMWPDTQYKTSRTAQKDLTYTDVCSPRIIQALYCIKQLNIFLAEMVLAQHSYICFDTKRLKKKKKKKREWIDLPV